MSEELKEQIEALQQKLAAMETKPSQATPSVVYMKSDRKFSKFGGRPVKESDPIVDEWIADMRDYIRSVPSKDSHVGFIMDHLTGNAKTEIRLGPNEQRESGEQILNALEQLYHSKDTITQLQQKFYQRDQQQGETLESYSLALMTMVDQITRRSGKEMPEKDKVLIERFIDGIKDQHLRQELRRISLEKGPMPFLEFRHTMLRWIEDNPSQTEKSVHKTSASEFSELMSVMKKQQELLEKQQEQIDYLTTLTSNRGSRDGNDPRRTSGRSRSFSRYPRYSNRGRGVGRGNSYGGNNMQCYNCGGRGHKASDCPSDDFGGKKSNENEARSQQKTGQSNDRPSR
ncbi:hypothetical protein FSP39_008981 [Pinctada imbricata]|uniref:CCHC-type domain-containing protein n=1 Tax=Pinctada imbricata TaxID=66713 RepID=A0AA89CC01_PINIB|nr:hypothetical protein FSP39_008981 [Pinctada imbricata]